ncbi:MAG: 2-amino-4-hydroxy-6-hydroxymethyldihydropteridine diphosphokinase [Planctomycetota bacterium]|nr:MAG: 2-amino-4-hydroxy-6-hydroxymethyldihydropteridine diphosphokinase [Planctomycetota bacterium]
MRYLIGLGSNLGDRGAELCEARGRLAATPFTLIQQSRVYESPAWGDRGAPPFLNAVVEVESDSGPWAALRSLQGLEDALGRVRMSRRNAPRSIDLDLIAADRVWMNSRELTLPHPRLWRRAFVLVPLRDLEGTERFFPRGLPSSGASPIAAVEIPGW